MLIKDFKSMLSRKKIRRRASYQTEWYARLKAFRVEERDIFLLLDKAKTLSKVTIYDIATILWVAYFLVVKSVPIPLILIALKNILKEGVKNNDIALTTRLWYCAYVSINKVRMGIR